MDFPCGPKNEVDTRAQSMPRSMRPQASSNQYGYICRRYAQMHALVLPVATILRESSLKRARMGRSLALQRCPWDFAPSLHKLHVRPPHCTPTTKPYQRLLNQAASRQWSVGGAPQCQHDKLLSLTDPMWACRKCNAVPRKSMLEANQCAPPSTAERTAGRVPQRT